MVRFFIRRIDLKSTSHSPLRRGQLPWQGSQVQGCGFVTGVHIHETIFVVGRWCHSGVAVLLGAVMTVSYSFTGEGSRPAADTQFGGRRWK